jgi:hypothetical protein
MPSVSFTKAIDVWMVSCLVFVFAAFIEYSIVNVLARKDRKQGRRDSYSALQMVHPTKDEVNTSSVHVMVEILVN